jgi:4-amino-4-deoxy-L-arabinose transferase-like glycosyltransferase
MIDQPTAESRWWREPQVFWLAVLVVAAYFVRLDALALRGEETRRAQVAIEMLDSGDWIVPHFQGTIYVTRPPLGNWLIAVTGWIRGRVDVVAIRLPSLLAVLLTTLLVYGYSRGLLSRYGAFAAAVAYPTMAQVLQIGRLAETEAVFTLLTAASLLVWHAGYHRKATRTLGASGSLISYWTAGYVLAALAGLTKGPQGPVYFVVPVVANLLVRRDWRSLFSRGHAAGVVAFLAVIACWQVPYYLATDWETSRSVWVQQASTRFVTLDWDTMLRHLLLYPLEVAACMLPWSLCGVHLFRREFYRQSAPMRDQRQFLLIALLTTFPTLWFAVSAESRYFMPLYPVAAVLFGAVIEYSLRPDAGLMSSGWRLYLRGCGVTFVAAALAVLALRWSTNPVLQRAALPHAASGGLLAVAVAVCVYLFRAARTTDRLRHAAAVASIAGFAGLCYAGVGIHAISARQRDIGRDVAFVRERLPVDVRLVSFGKVSHIFCYHYGQMVPRRPVPARGGDYADVDYFCIQEKRGVVPQLPFRWVSVARVSLAKSPTSSDVEYVIVGRRLGPERTAARK